jgi:hypothetical protein
MVPATALPASHTELLSLFSRKTTGHRNGSPAPGGEKGGVGDEVFPFGECSSASRRGGQHAPAWISQSSSPRSRSLSACRSLLSPYSACATCGADVRQLAGLLTESSPEEAGSFLFDTAMGC